MKQSLSNQVEVVLNVDGIDLDFLLEEIDFNQTESISLKPKTESLVAF